MMSSPQHQDMRTTLTLDDDVAAKLKAESRRARRPFKEIVNETLRSGQGNRLKIRVTNGRRAESVVIL